MAKVPWLNFRGPPQPLKPSRLLGAALWPREESPHRLGAEESLRWRSGACPKSKSLLPLTYLWPSRHRRLLLLQRVARQHGQSAAVGGATACCPGRLGCEASGVGCATHSRGAPTPLWHSGSIWGRRQPVPKLLIRISTAFDHPGPAWPTTCSEIAPRSRRPAAASPRG